MFFQHFVVLTADGKEIKLSQSVREKNYNIAANLFTTASTEAGDNKSFKDIFNKLHLGQLFHETSLTDELDNKAVISYQTLMFLLYRTNVKSKRKLLIK